MSFKAIGREGVLLAVASSITGIMFGANSVILSIYMLNIGMKPTLIGVVIGASSLMSALGSLITGYLSDFINKLSLFTFLSLASGSLILLLVTGLPPVITMVYPLIALLNRNVISIAISGEYARRRGISSEFFSLSSSLNVVFSVIGSSITMLPSYMGRMGYDLVFIIESLSVYSSIPIMLIAIRRIGINVTEVKISRVSLRELRELKSSWLLKRLIPESLIGLGAGVIIPLFSLWFYLKFHINISNLSIVYAASNATLALGTLTAPMISRILRSRVTSVILLEGLATGILALMPIILNIPSLLVLFIVRNTLMNMANPLLTSLINDLVPGEERGRVFGIWMLLSSIPRALGPGIGGYLMGSGYLDLPLYITSLLYATAVALFYVLLKDVEKMSRLTIGR
ncbi:MFS transporter [Caldivirga maquilingensis]|uniref:Major facilitator superfamily MFS_1 n=1 Tax=Caldivirga maquilingensis (strain ATCC 700844 / DSM 13496 / JCM 10307 / IC-167) TaxID=397948 RepID=A8MDW4_CALMQ|nr:MFS transporter [Caldivirga maquilingensis]ABW01970.1 major facilitator superfamily MFS_1 [Caldivirga maquilingensis IC-167]